METRATYKLVQRTVDPAATPETPAVEADRRVNEMALSRERLTLETGGLYIDYYDHHFDTRSLHPRASCWNRNKRPDFPSRREAFLAMALFDVPMPTWGTCAQLKTRFGRDCDEVVVYTDESMHQGLGKERLLRAQAIEEHPERLFSAYIRSVNGTARSRRYLMIGEEEHIIEYESREDWRSNHLTDDIGIVQKTCESPYVATMRELMRIYVSPIIAIDFVPHCDGHWLATDLNLAPGMRGTGIEDVVPAKRAFELIRDAWFGLREGTF